MVFEDCILTKGFYIHILLENGDKMWCKSHDFWTKSAILFTIDMRSALIVSIRVLYVIFVKFWIIQHFKIHAVSGVTNKQKTTTVLWVGYSFKINELIRTSQVGLYFFNSTCYKNASVWNKSFFFHRICAVDIQSVLEFLQLNHGCLASYHPLRSSVCIFSVV